jgi:hypothetical protein
VLFGMGGLVCSSRGGSALTLTSTLIIESADQEDDWLCEPQTCARHRLGRGESSFGEGRLEFCETAFPPRGVPVPVSRTCCVGDSE